MKYNPYNKLLDSITYIFGLICLSAVIILIILTSFTGFRLEKIVPPCLFYRLTGYYCPGCGGTRSVIALAGGHFIKSFLYHPFVIYTAAFLTLFLITQTVYRIRRLSTKCESSPDKITIHVITVNPACIYAGCILLILQWIIKNLILWIS